MPQPKKHACAAARQAAYRRRRDQTRLAQLSVKGLPALPAMASMPGWARWNGALQMARALVEETLGEMQDYYGDRSESWQESGRGEQHEERMAAVEAVVDALSEVNW
jgi:hypothetical protein